MPQLFNRMDSVFRRGVRVQLVRIPVMPKFVFVNNLSPSLVFPKVLEGFQGGLDLGSVLSLVIRSAWFPNVKILYVTRKLRKIAAYI